MMQEQLYALYMFTVQSNGGVVTTLLVDFEDLLYPGECTIHPFFCIKMTANDARAVIKNHFA